MSELSVVKLNKNNFKNILSLKSKFISNLKLDDLNKIIFDKHHDIFVLLSENDFIGYIEFMTIVPESEIYSIIISENKRRQGYATYLLNWLVDYLKKYQCSTIYLEVNKINIEAINLYKKFGFVVYGERKKYYGDNDAILLKYEL